MFALFHENLELITCGRWQMPFSVSFDKRTRRLKFTFRTGPKWNSHFARVQNFCEKLENSTFLSVGKAPKQAHLFQGRDRFVTKYILQILCHCPLQSKTQEIWIYCTKCPSEKPFALSYTSACPNHTWCVDAEMKKSIGRLRGFNMKVLISASYICRQKL